MSGCRISVWNLAMSERPSVQPSQRGGKDWHKSAILKHQAPDRIRNVWWLVWHSIPCNCSLVRKTWIWRERWNFMHRKGIFRGEDLHCRGISRQSAKPITPIMYCTLHADVIWWDPSQGGEATSVIKGGLPWTHWDGTYLLSSLFSDWFKLTSSTIFSSLTLQQIWFKLSSTKSSSAPY